MTDTNSLDSRKLSLSTQKTLRQRVIEAYKKYMVSSPFASVRGIFWVQLPPGGRVHARPPFNTWRSHTTKFGLSRIRVGNSCAESNRQTVVE